VTTRGRRCFPEDRLTYHVRLVLDNDEALHLERRALVQAWLEGEFPRLFDGSTLTLEVLTTALAYVDWDALAASYAEDEREMLAQEAAV
jgi:hypothetical protein